MTVTINIVRYRPRRARVAVAYSTKDRVELTRETVAGLLDHPDIDLYWFDGSKTEAGLALPLDLCPGHLAPCEVHRGIVGGPDRAIMYALETLRTYAYDLVILIENDVLLLDGWFGALQASIRCGQAAGFKVGGASLRVVAERVLSFNDDYCLLINSGAGCIALTPAAVDVVLANCRTTDTAEIFDRFQSLTGIQLTPPGKPTGWHPLCADWLFDLMLYLHGYVVTAPPVSYVRMLDGYPWVFVTDPQHSLQQRQSLVTRPDQIQTLAYKSFRFQKSPLSDRLLIGCHHLRIGVGDDTAPASVRATGHWRREWVQGVGPFALVGLGQITVELHGSTIGFFMEGGATGAELHLADLNGSPRFAAIVGPGTMTEIIIDPVAFPDHGAMLKVASGECRLIGVTAPPTLLPFYANGWPSVDHLPA